ncbi:hypothetical protein OCA99_23670 [Bacillus cereus]|nr:hypothetical protein [Bacillus cereus]
MDKHYVDKRVSDLEQSIEGLKTTVSMLSEVVKTKVDTTDVQLIIKQSEVVKKNNESEPNRTDCKVNIKLDGKVMAESIAEHTADSIQGRVIKRSEINEIN